MAEPRDRLSRAVDVAAIFARRRSGVHGILVDESGTGLDLFGSPIRQQSTVTTSARRLTDFGARRGGGYVSGSFRTPRTGNLRGRNLHGSSSAGRENVPPLGSGWRGRGRATNSPLPSWYPRTPLRDITAIIRV